MNTTKRKCRTYKLKGYYNGVFVAALLLLSNHLLAQTKGEAEIIKISKDIFRWEIEGKMDSLDIFFDENLIVVGSNGKTRPKSEYLADLKNGKPVHNKIDIEEESVKIHSTTAILTGKGIFNVAVSDNKSSLHLSYMEVFILKNKSWKLVALYASRIPE